MIKNINYNLIYWNDSKSLTRSYTSFIGGLFQKSNQY